ncbi:MAG: DUF2520 domain-containing protein [Desulfosarcinaceae bacterium]
MGIPGWELTNNQEGAMRIGFIGAGKVGTAFGQYLRSHGFAISGYHDHHPDKMRHACEMTGGRVFEKDADLAGASDMLLITTRDDQIAPACEALCRRKAVTPDHWVGHMSGAHDTSVLDAASRCGAAVFSLHPLQSFAEEAKAVAGLPATYFSLEGSDPRVEAVADILARTCNTLFRIAARHKSLYHLAACIFSNYLTTIIDMGMSALGKSGIDPQQGFTAMLPLIQGSIDNIAAIGPAKALTGPIARGDASTIARHLETLSAQDLEQLKKSYAFLGLQTLELARREILTDQDKAEAIRKLFAACVE